MVSSKIAGQPVWTVRPTLLNSCARAATRAEAAFRLDYPLAPSRATRVVGLDPAAADAVRRVAQLTWHHTRFYGVPEGGDGLLLSSSDGAERPLAGELAGVDAMIMVATTDEGADAASVIGAACKVRGVMTAGLVMTPGQVATSALFALRPYARILLVPADEEDLVELLKAIRA